MIRVSSRIRGFAVRTQTRFSGLQGCFRKLVSAALIGQMAVLAVGRQNVVARARETQPNIPSRDRKAIGNWRGPREIWDPKNEPPVLMCFYLVPQTYCFTTGRRGGRNCGRSLSSKAPRWAQTRRLKPFTDTDELPSIPQVAFKPAVNTVFCNKANGTTNTVLSITLASSLEAKGVPILRYRFIVELMNGAVRGCTQTLNCS